MKNLQPQRKIGSGGSLVPFLLLAALFHALLVPWVSSFWQRSQPTAAKTKTKEGGWVRLDSQNVAGRRRAVELAKLQRTAALRRQPVKEAMPAGQVVDVPPTADDSVPEHAKYLSEHNTRVARESRSRHAASHDKNVMNEPTEARRGEAARLGGGTAAGMANKARLRNAKEGLHLGGRVRERERLALRLDPALGVFRNHERNDGADDAPGLVPGVRAEAGAKTAGQGSPTTGTGPGGPPGSLSMDDLVPSVGVMARLSGGPRNDALEGVDLGEGTFLNSREFKYASFFNRLHRSVSNQWKPMVEYQQRDPTGHVYGLGRRVTTVLVTLDLAGALKDIAVKRSSGLDFLDQEAVAAFQRAEPFPNPPQALADSQGLIIFAFGFHVEVGSGGFGGY